ncbi:hypothetical protein LEN26_017443 [Aphanomyces euteiches]|nr:hypothetical protein LEN26_017443 [Aphanomyces euteiches]KAH9129218.1 hypothetical protein AeMF1_000723 [Aphanomyces euteiches]KAH9186651.1 hypothetical protein AeNC1_011368 [Aphanomyces euteiches]
MSPNETKIATSRCPHAAGAKAAAALTPEDIPCAYTTMPAAAKDNAKLTTSASLGEYHDYLKSLNRNTYGAYIRLTELEKTWGLWSLRASTPMPFDPYPELLQPAPDAPEAPSAALYRLAPAMSSLEITLRLALDFIEVNLPAIDDPKASPTIAHRPYVQHDIRLDALLRNITTQLEMIRCIIELDNVNDPESTYRLTPQSSQETVAQPREWWWQGAHPVASPKSFIARVAAQVQAQFADLPFGLGALSESKALQLPYDQVVAPKFVRQHCTENEAAFPEDHFFATVHQICEAWCCVLERQLDAAQEDIDALTLDGDDVANHNRLRLIARRYRFCCRAWEFLNDHCTILTEMDMRDYHSFRLQLHGASGGQSVRMRQLRKRTFHLLPLIPRDFAAHVLPKYDEETKPSFESSEWMDLLQLLAHVGTSENPEEGPHAMRHLELLYADHNAPACHVMAVVQAVQTLENAVRRYYFGHQYMAIMVLGGGNTGSDGLTVKMLERTWKDPRRYYTCEMAKTDLSHTMDALHYQREPDAKGKLMQRLLAESKARRAYAPKELTRCPQDKMAVVA